MGALIQVRRDSNYNWYATNPVLSAGEPGYDLDLKIFKIGDGTTPWNNLTPSAPEVGYSSVVMGASTSDPSSLATDTIRLYNKTLAARNMPKVRSRDGLPFHLQPLLATSRFGMMNPIGGTNTPTYIGSYSALTALGTATARAVTTASFLTRLRRLGYVSAATAGSFAGVRTSVGQITTGGPGPGTGFFKVIRFGISDATLVSGSRMFVGLSTSVSAPTNVNPDTLKNCIGVGHQDLNIGSTNLQLYYGGTYSQSPIELQGDFIVSSSNATVYELALWAPQDRYIVGWQVTNLNSGYSQSGVIPCDDPGMLPPSTSLLCHTLAWRNNNTTASAVGLDIISDYIETDY